jgi:hypothetical protein
MNWRARWNAPAAVNRYFLARKLEMTVFIFAREAGKTDKLIKDYLEIYDESEISRFYICTER